MNQHILLPITNALVYVIYINCTLGMVMCYNIYYTMLKHQHLIVYKWHKENEKSKHWTLKHTWTGNQKLFSFIAVLVSFGVQIFFLYVMYICHSE